MQNKNNRSKSSLRGVIKAIESYRNDNPISKNLSQKYFSELTLNPNIDKLVKQGKSRNSSKLPSYEVYKNLTRSEAYNKRKQRQGKLVDYAGGALDWDKNIRHNLDLLGRTAKETQDDSFSFGNSLRTFGNNECVSFPTGLSAIDGASKLSIHYWVTVSSDEIAVVGGGDSGGSRIHLIKFSNNNIVAIMANGGGTLGFCSFDGYEDTKTLVSMVFDGTDSPNENRLKIYINAVQQNLTFQGQINSTAPNESSDFRINLYEFQNSFGKADYDEIVVATDASTESQISEFYNSGNGNLATDAFTNIIAYWRCNEEDGATTLSDSVGTANGVLDGFSTPPAYFVSS